MNPVLLVLAARQGVSFVQTATGSIVVNWAAPASLGDGTTPADIAGYRVSWGVSPGVYTSSADVGVVNTYTITGVIVGQWFVNLQTKNTAGVLGEYGQETLLIAA